MASHYRAGEILYEQLSGNNFRFTVYTYTDPQSFADPSTANIVISFGDGKSQELNRVSKTLINNNIQQNVYVVTHLYSSEKTYKISIYDQYRVNDIININFGNTQYIAFYVETTIRINSSLNNNRSPILTKLPVDDGCKDYTYYHNPSAYDPDGDSLTFEIVPPKQENGLDVPNYTDPDIAAINGLFNIDKTTGQLTWHAPQKTGIYNIAILIKEFRGGQFMGSVVRDMQINIKACRNNPPIIQPVADGCVVYGDSITRIINAYDPDTNSIVTLTSYGGPFVVNRTAYFKPNPASGNKTIATQFVWKPSCNHIRYFSWQAVFEAKDYFNNAPAVSQNSFFIQVVGPPVINVNVQQQGNGFNLSWNKDTCGLAVEYHIYRKIDSSFWQPAYCQKGIPPSTGFKYIGKVATLNNPATNFFDNNGGAGMSPLISYCYRIVALYPARNSTGNIIFSSPTESMASAEVCGLQIVSATSITKVSVLHTDSFVGKIDVNYIKPDYLDTLVYKAPYRVILKRAVDAETNPFIVANTSDFSSLTMMSNISVIDSLLNTFKPHYYLTEFYATVNGTLTLIGASLKASSVYTSIYSTDRENRLTWKTTVPWQNDTFFVTRKNALNQFDTIATTTNYLFNDTGLINKTTYCYQIISLGNYRADGQKLHTSNYSQQICGTPIDTVPPCPPPFTVASPCNNPNQVTNIIKWNAVNNCSGDVVGYRVYFKQLIEDEYELIASPTISETSYNDNRDITKQTITGCYYVTAVDSIGNESKMVYENCIENCPKYTLPNVFTPGSGKADGINDLFIPFPYRFVSGVNFHVFNRWGIEVFNTDNIDILWDGKDINTKQDLPEGVYYYTCEVSEVYLEGIKKRLLNGTIQIIRE